MTENTWVSMRIFPEWELEEKEFQEGDEILPSYIWG